MILHHTNRLDKRWHATRILQRCFQLNGHLSTFTHSDADHEPPGCSITLRRFHRTSPTPDQCRSEGRADCIDTIQRRKEQPLNLYSVVRRQIRLISASTQNLFNVFYGLYHGDSSHPSSPLTTLIRRLALPNHIDILYLRTSVWSGSRCWLGVCKGTALNGELPIPRSVPGRERGPEMQPGP